MAEIQHVTTETFKDVVLGSDKPVLVDFWASWCQPCLMMNPTLEELADELDGKVTIAKVNVDEERALGAMFQIMSIPAMLVFNGGQKVDEFIGVQPKENISAKLEALA